MSILLAFHKDDKPNSHLQMAIDEWQKVYEDNEHRCEISTQKRSRKLNPKMRFAGSLFPVRNLTDTTPFGTGGWDPFDPSLVTTIYHWGYWGSCEFGNTIIRYLYFICMISQSRLTLIIIFSDRTAMQYFCSMESHDRTCLYIQSSMDSDEKDPFY